MKAPPTSEESARSAFAKYKEKDPYPGIESSLLSAADIYDYALQVGMIYPFDKSNLKPATYALTVGGPYVMWEYGKKTEGDLKPGNYLTLKKDSILFLTLEPLIQLPIYIAARFNLKIDHVYKGLLLGTGPMVDPGFVGKLSIPLHNLTTNDYHFRGGDKLIWMEFTKLSSHPDWAMKDSEFEREGEVVPFGKNKKVKERGLLDYIYEADKRPIESTIPASVTKQIELTKEAAASAKKVEEWSKVVLAINLAIVVAVMALVWAVYSQTSTFYNNSKQEIYKHQDDLQTIENEKIEVLQNQIDSLKRAINKQAGRKNH